MGLDDDIAILAAAPLFRFFGHDALRLITFASERLALAADTVLFRRGDPRGEQRGQCRQTGHRIPQRLTIL